MHRRDRLILLAVAMLFNFGLASFIHEPGYLDDAYYFGGALRLAQGHGFSEPYLWNYLRVPAALPQPSHLYWMPLTSIVAAIPMLLVGPSFAAARLPFVILAGLLPLAAYSLAYRVSESRRTAVFAGLLAIFCGYYPAFWGTTDSFALFGVIGVATLWAIARADQGADWRWELAAGAGAGLAHLTRADGSLLLVVGLVVLARSWHFVRAYPALVVRHLLLSILGYLAVMLPWFIRNIIVAGAPLPGGAATVWMTEYNDLFLYPSVLTADRYFALGLGPILAGKWDALLINLQRVVAEQGWIFFTPFIVVGLWRLRAHPRFRPVLIYAALLYGVMTFVFTFAGARGGLFHSSPALLPFYAAAGLVGLEAVIDWVAARLKHWKPEQAKVNFSILAIAGAVVLTVGVSVPPLLAWNGAAARFREIAARIPMEAVVMSNNPPGFWTATGRPGVPLVNGDDAALAAVIEQFDVQYILLDTNFVAGMQALYENDGAPGLRRVGQWDEWKLFEVVR
jgi:4-amino-4-deoxy-L-arabinose transferase-like glycosyltransferase